MKMISSPDDTEIQGKTLSRRDLFKRYSQPVTAATSALNSTVQSNPKPDEDGDDPLNPFLQVIDQATKITQENPKVKRRTFLGGALVSLGLAFFGSGKANAPSAETPSQPNYVPIPSVKEEADKTSELTPIPQKNELDQKIEEIDKTLALTWDWRKREALLEDYYNLRQSGKTSLPVLSEEKIRWAEKMNIHPATLLRVLDVQDKATTFIEWAFNKNRRAYRPELVARGKDVNTLTADQIMMNAGGIAMLLCTESGIGVQYELYKQPKKYIVPNLGLINLGEELALAKDPQSTSALEELLQIVKEDCGIVYQKEKIPGSSAGAIAMQMMIPRVLEIAKQIREYNKTTSKEKQIDINPFNPNSFPIYTWIFMSRGYDIEAKDGVREYRYGYLKGDSNIIDDAIEAWNKDKTQIKKIHDAADDFWDTFNPQKTLARH